MKSQNRSLDAPWEEEEFPSKTVIVQEWEESEAGWGCRPDGVSVHLTLEDAKIYSDEFAKKQHKASVAAGIKGTPSEYTRISGKPYEKTVLYKIYKLVEKSKNGVMFNKLSELEGKKTT